MKRIPVGKNLWAIIDDEDYEKVNKVSWYKVGRKPYAAHTTQVFMHRFIMKPRKGQVVDHINGNPLDNRRSNLRKCSARQNGKNRLPTSKPHSSQYKGVSKSYSSWICKIRHNGKQILIGKFKNERHAALAYDLWALELHGAYARTNFKPLSYKI